MEEHRAGETSNIPFRNVRHFCINGEWFFETRDGSQQGPFESKEDMEGELLLFIRAQTMKKNIIDNK